MKIHHTNATRYPLFTEARFRFVTLTLFFLRHTKKKNRKMKKKTAKINKIYIKYIQKTGSAKRLACCLSRSPRTCVRVAKFSRRFFRPCFPHFFYSRKIGKAMSAPLSFPLLRRCQSKSVDREKAGFPRSWLARLISRINCTKF